MSRRLIQAIMVLCGLLQLYSCSKVDTITSGLTGKPIKVIGHGGMGFASIDNAMPINSKGSLLRAVEGWNVDGVEVDVQLSEDSLLFLYHDERLPSMTDCNGCVAEKKAVLLRNCRYRSGITANVFSNEHVLELDSFMQLMANRSIPPLVFLDVKTFFNCTEEAEPFFIERFARAVNRLVRKYDAEDWILIDANDLSFIRAIHSLNERIKLIFAAEWSDDLLAIAEFHQLYGLSFEEDEVNAAQIQQVQNAGRRVILWDAGARPELLSAVNKQPDFIYTDNIPLLQGILNP